MKSDTFRQIEATEDPMLRALLHQKALMRLSCPNRVDHAEGMAKAATELAHQMRVSADAPHIPSRLVVDGIDYTQSALPNPDGFSVRGTERARSHLGGIFDSASKVLMIVAVPRFHEGKQVEFNARISSLAPAGDRIDFTVRSHEEIRFSDG